MIQNNINLTAPSLTDIEPLSSTIVEQRQKSGNEFGTYLSEALDTINELQFNADQMRADYETGATDDLASVMIASQKSSLAFQGLMQVRNKAVSAYETVFNMPV